MTDKLAVLNNYFTKDKQKRDRVIEIYNLTQDEIDTALRTLKIPTTPKQTVGQWGDPYYAAIYDQNHLDGTYAVVSGNNLYISYILYFYPKDLKRQFDVDGRKFTNTLAGGVYGGMLGAAIGSLTKTYITVDCEMIFEALSDDGKTVEKQISFKVANNQKLLPDYAKRLVNDVTKFCNAYVEIKNRFNWLEATTHEMITVFGEASGINPQGEEVDKKKVNAMQLYLLHITHHNNPGASVAPKQDTVRIPFPELE